MRTLLIIVESDEFEHTGFGNSSQLLEVPPHAHNLRRPGFRRRTLNNSPEYIFCLFLNDNNSNFCCFQVWPPPSLPTLFRMTELRDNKSVNIGTRSNQTPQAISRSSRRERKNTIHSPSLFCLSHSLTHSPFLTHEYALTHAHSNVSTPTNTHTRT